MNINTTLAAAALSLVLLAAGCDSKTYNETYIDGVSTDGPKPTAQIGHVVLLTLSDPADTDELVAASREALADIPGLTHYSAGVHLETGREAVLSNYHVALYIGFDSEEDYAAYLVHPDHVAFVDAWQPRFESIVIYDIADAD